MRLRLNMSVLGTLAAVATGCQAIAGIEDVVDGRAGNMAAGGDSAHAGAPMTDVPGGIAGAAENGGVAGTGGSETGGVAGVGGTGGNAGVGGMQKMPVDNTCILDESLLGDCDLG